VAVSVVVSVLGAVLAAVPASMPAAVKSYAYVDPGFTGLSYFLWLILVNSDGSL
jgi:hypothetical protein